MGRTGEGCLHASSSSARATQAAAESALDQLDYAGVFVFVGHGQAQCRGSTTTGSSSWSRPCIGAYNYDAEGFGPALDLLASGSLPLDVLIEAEDVPLDKIVPVMERLAGGEIPGKVLVRPEVSQVPT